MSGQRPPTRPMRPSGMRGPAGGFGMGPPGPGDGKNATLRLLMVD